jgi:hypothetical protein
MMNLKLRIDPSSPIFKELEKARLKINELDESAKALFEHAFNLLLERRDLVSEFLRFETCDSSTSTSDFLISLNPTNSFSVFLAALAAGDVNSLVVEHGH